MTKALQSGLLTESNMALFADYYELTMGKADFDNGNNAICTENYFVRYIPQGEYLIAAGLEQVIHYILNLRFTDADLKWLKESKPTPDMSDDSSTTCVTSNSMAMSMQCLKGHPSSQTSR